MTTSMTDHLPPCPECSSAYVYQVDNLLTCPECGHEWVSEEPADTALEVRDSVGNTLVDGDTVTVIKDLKIRGVNGGVKFGHCGGAKVGQFGASALERAALI
jgi:protein PhnA